MKIKIIKCDACGKIIGYGINYNNSESDQKNKEIDQDYSKN